MSKINDAEDSEVCQKQIGLQEKFDRQHLFYSR